MTSIGEAATNGPAWLRFGRAVVRRAFDRNAADGTSMPPLADDAFDTLAANAGLPQVATEVLAVLVAADIDVSTQHLVARAHGDGARRRITVGMLPLLFDAGPDAMLAVAPGAALERAAFTTVEGRGPLGDREIAVAPAVVWALIGATSSDPDLPMVDELELPERGDDTGEAATIVVVTGADPARRRRAGAAATMADRFLACRAPDTVDEWAALVREATITGRGLIVEIDDGLPDVGRRAIERSDHLVWVITATHPPVLRELPRRAWVAVEVPSREASADEWTAVLGADVGRPHRLTLDQLERVARVLPAVGGDVDAAVRRLSAGRLEQLTHRIRPTRRWDDIVVSPSRRALLESIVDRARLDVTVFDKWGYDPRPSRGLVAMFAGASGTGKTLAAEIIAGELGLDLFKLDLSSVVSKYIGETEQRLDELFDAASAGNAVLFFDEADSLFGKRSEVSDARDRYANIEVSYLLQRLESYDGVVVLATNFERNIDDAFVRRIHVRVEFAVPDVDERALIWRKAFPAGAPLAADVDLRWLAERFVLAGGPIRNAALTAGFVAAAEGGEIAMGHAVTGVAREYRKMGRLVTDKDFGDHIDSPT